MANAERKADAKVFVRPMEELMRAFEAPLLLLDVAAEPVEMPDAEVSLELLLAILLPVNPFGHEVSVASW